MAQKISVGSVVVHKNGYIKGTGVVISKSNDVSPEYEVIWQTRNAREGRFEHCGSSLVTVSLAESNV
jgi:hypothetical protein